MGIWLVENYPWYKRAALPVCKELFGHEASWHGTDHTWTWGNGAVVQVVTYEKLDSIESITASWASIDEYQNMGIDAYEVVLPRISDIRAKFPNILITGLPEWGSWAEYLANRSSDAKLFTEVATTINEQNIHTGFIKALQENLDPDEADRRLKGVKPRPKGAVFKNFEPALYPKGNLLYWDYDPELPAYLGIDWGYRCPAVILFQHDPERKWDIVLAEWHPKDTSTEELALLIRKTAKPRTECEPYDGFIRIDKVYSDPAGVNKRSDGKEDISDFAEHYGMWPIYTHKKRSVNGRIKACKGRVKNALGARRFFLTQEIWDSGITAAQHDPKGRSLALALIRTKWPETKKGQFVDENPVKSPVDSHPIDAWGYYVVNKYGLTEASTYEAR